MTPRRALALALAVVVVLAALGALAWHRPGGPRGSIVVCSAGSLGGPLRELASRYAGETGVKVQLKLAGSVDIVRQVSEMGARCDVIAVADYRLIPMYLYPNITSWYVVFAGNEMVIAWQGGHEALGRVLGEIEAGKASYGFSDPNRDPAGYRAVGALALYSLYYNDTLILQRLERDLPGLHYRYSGGVLHVYVPPTPTPRGELVVRPKSVELLSLIESGELRYAILYRSEAIEHNLAYAPLPPRASLGDPARARDYSRVVVHILAGTPHERAIPMAPIAYGITVARDSSNPQAAIGFVIYILQHGADAFKSRGFVFYTHPIGYGSLPPELQGVVEAGG